MNIQRFSTKANLREVGVQIVYTEQREETVTGQSIQTTRDVAWSVVWDEKRAKWLLENPVILKTEGANEQPP